MIVGRGMFARAFEHFRDHPDVVIFASGVSDSTEINSVQFERESTLLRTTLERQSDTRFVYFGTCSVSDPQLCQTPYVKHKVTMERLVRSSASRYFIFRVPQAVGQGGNKNTVINKLCGCIRRGERFQLWRHAYRYILDVEDVAAIAGYMIDCDEYLNRVTNIASRPFSVFDIVHVLEATTGRAAIYTEVDKSASYDINCHAAHEVAKLLDVRFDEAYLDRVIRKYYAE